MENHLIINKENVPDWIKEVAQDLSNSPEALNLWQKFQQTVESEGDSVAKQYIDALFGELKEQIVSEIHTMAKSISEEVSDGE